MIEELRLFNLFLIIPKQATRRGQGNRQEDTCIDYFIVNGQVNDLAPNLEVINTPEISDHNAILLKIA